MQQSRVRRYKNVTAALFKVGELSDELLLDLQLGEEGGKSHQVGKPRELIAHLAVFAFMQRKSLCYCIKYSGSRRLYLTICRLNETWLVIVKA